MQWEVWLIPLIAFGAWILSTIFKATESEKPGEKPMDGTRRPRRPPQPRSRPQATPAWMEPRPQPRIQQPRPQRPVRPAPIVATIVEETVRVVVPPPVEPAPSITALPMAVALSPRPVSPVAQEVMRLLGSPQTAGVAFVLREILDRPVGMRKK